MPSDAVSSLTICRDFQGARAPRHRGFTLLTALLLLAGGLAYAPARLAARAAPPAAAPAAPAASAALAPRLGEELDQMLAATYPPDQPGASVLVSRGGEVLVRKGYGMANLELGVPIKPETVFELGSLTKQFTAAGILLLAERGKLGLDDEITRYLPDFPMHGKRITLQHLLTHTSGIVNYTGVPEWAAHMRDDLTPAEVVALFKDKPLDFAPGERWAYDNSGYFLLGMVLDKVSGKSYAQFMMDEVFKPLGMTSTRYGSNADLIPHRASGYDQEGEVYRNASYISMTHPYAAGALVSDLDDLALWDRALYGESLLKKASLARMFTPGQMSSGASTRYANGWIFSELGGHAVTWHGGGINGYHTALLRVPDQRLLVVVLTNHSPGHKPSPDAMAIRLAARVLGVPAQPPTLAAGTLDAATLEGYAGVYVDEDSVKRVVSRDGDHLFVQRSGGDKTEILPTARDRFISMENPSRLRFQRDGQGRVTGAMMDRGAGPEAVLRKTDEPIPAERQAIHVSPAVLDAYVGAYELHPGFVLTITRDGERLFAQATGQPQLELFAESETRFFLKPVDAQVEFAPPPAGGGSSPQLILHQGGQDVTGKRMP